MSKITDMAGKVAAWGPLGAILTSKAVWMTAFGASLMGGLWVYLEHVEDKGYDRAKMEFQAKIDNAAYEHRKVVMDKDTEILMLRNQREQEIAAAQRANKQLRSDYAEILEELDEKLAAAEKKAAEKQKIKIKEVIKYVPPEVDASHPVPIGFVRFHDEAARADAFEAPGFGLPLSPSFDVGAPSAVTLSGVAATVSDNYGECHERGTIIEAWQAWYREVVEAFETATKMYGLSITMPDAPK